MSPMPAGTGYGPLIGSGNRELQQLCQCGCPGLMHGRAHRRLDGFQIETARLAATMEEDAQQLVYFARDFLPDRGRRFFFCVDVAASSHGRNRQIFSFTSTNS